MCLFIHKNRQRTAHGACCHHSCIGLCSNQSTGLKILHKGEPSAPSSHILCGRPPARTEVGLLLILPRTAEGQEVQSWGGEYVQMKAGNTLRAGCVLHVRSTETAETTRTCSWAGTPHVLTYTAHPWTWWSMRHCAQKITGLVWVRSTAHPRLVQSGQTVRCQCCVTSKLTRLLNRADEVWHVLLGQWELAVLAFCQAEDRTEAV